MFAYSRGGSAQSEGETWDRRRQWSGPRAIKGNGLLLPSGDLLDRSAWAATLTIDIGHVVANREGVFRADPESGLFDIVNRSRTRNVGCVRRPPLIGPRDEDSLGGSLRSVYRLLATVGEFS